MHRKTVSPCLVLPINDLNIFFYARGLVCANGKNALQFIFMVG